MEAEPTVFDREAEGPDGGVGPVVGRACGGVADRGPVVVVQGLGDAVTDP